MTQNGVAGFLRMMGLIIGVLGIIGSFILGYFTADYTYSDYNWSVMLIGVLSSIISGGVMVGFGEAIDLLQKNVNKQNEIISHLENRITHNTVQNKQVNIQHKYVSNVDVQDIERNLPKM